MRGTKTMNIIDLFAGCGGLSLGFEMAGFNIPVAIEKDEWASETYKKNHPTTKVITEDITQILDLYSILADGIKTIDCFEFHMLSKQSTDSTLLEVPSEFPTHILG